MHKWKETELAELRAQLDAAYFILYGLPQDDVEYILSTFSGLAAEDDSPALVADSGAATLIL